MPKLPSRISDRAGFPRFRSGFRLIFKIMPNSEKRICQNCKNDFEIDAQDFSFYEKIKVPPPTFCPECRMQRRMVFMNDRTLYSRECDLCKKKIISVYPAGVPHPVYCSPCWWSDGWQPESFANDYDFSKPFF